jgi:hypothetical protein
LAAPKVPARVGPVRHGFSDQPRIIQSALPLVVGDEVNHADRLFLLSSLNHQHFVPISVSLALGVIAIESLRQLVL